VRVPEEPETQASGATDAQKAARSERPAPAARDTRDARGEPAVKEILNIEEASAFLGVSTKTFQKVLREGDMPGRKVGREWKFWRRALAEWVGRGRSRDFLDSSDRDEASARAPAPLARRAAAAANGGRESDSSRKGNGHRSLDAEED
jgi:excisionase family DNA binding protein